MSINYLGFVDPYTVPNKEPMSIDSMGNIDPYNRSSKLEASVSLTIFFSTCFQVITWKILTVAHMQP